MAKFKAGDRVRLTGHPYGCDDEGIYVRKEKDSSCRGKHFVRVSYEDGSPCSTLSFKRRELALIDTPAPAEQEQGEPAEAKFKVGDRVRATSACTFRTGIEVGDEAVITGWEGEYWTLDFTHPTDGTIKQWARDEHIELVTTPDWQPKVGDRVRKRNSEGEGRPAGSVGTIAGKACTMWRVDFDAPFDGWGVDYRSWHCTADDLEPLPVAAEAQGADTLTIQPGRYYRTRDGRKVGPVRHEDGPGNRGQYYWRSNDDLPKYVAAWCQDGGYYSDGSKHRFDLVAEWPSEDPVAVAPATATAAFKVGDRVRTSGAFTFDPTEGEIVAFDQELIKVRVQNDGHGGDIWSYYVEELEPASAPVSSDTQPTIRPGQFATLRVKVTGIHPHGTHANVNIPGLRNPSHGVPLSALTAA